MLLDFARTGARRWSVVCSALLVALAVVSLAGASAYAGGGVGSVRVATTAPHSPPRPGDDFPQLPKKCRTDSFANPTDFCHVVSYGRGAPLLVAWGDSHVWMYLPALKRVARRRHDNLVVILAGGCPPVLPKPQSPRYGHIGCENHDAKAVSYLRHLRAHGRDFRLIVGAWWDGYRTSYYQVHHGNTGHATAYEKRIAEIAHHDTRPLFNLLGRLHVGTDVLAQAGTVPAHPPHCSRGRTPYRCYLRRSLELPQEAANRHWVRSHDAGLTKPSRYIDPSSVYCGPHLCAPSVDGRPTFFDDIHIGATLTATMTRFFAPSFAALRSHR